MVNMAQLNSSINLLYLLFRFPTSSSLVWPEHRQDMTCLIRLFETAETNKTLISIFLEITFSAVCGFERKMWLTDLGNSIDQKFSEWNWMWIFEYFDILDHINICNWHLKRNTYNNIAILVLPWCIKILL